MSAIDPTPLRRLIDFINLLSDLQSAALSSPNWRIASRETRKRIDTYLDAVYPQESQRATWRNLIADCRAIIPSRGAAGGEWIARIKAAEAIISKLRDWQPPYGVLRREEYRDGERVCDVIEWQPRFQMFVAPRPNLIVEIGGVVLGETGPTPAELNREELDDLTTGACSVVMELMLLERELEVESRFDTDAGTPHPNVSPRHVSAKDLAAIVGIAPGTMRDLINDEANEFPSHVNSIKGGNSRTQRFWLWTPVLKNILIKRWPKRQPKIEEFDRAGRIPE
jgi:hypothetical protein